MMDPTERSQMWDYPDCGILGDTIPHAVRDPPRIHHSGLYPFCGVPHNKKERGIMAVQLVRVARKH